MRSHGLQIEMLFTPARLSIRRTVKLPISRNGFLALLDSFRRKVAAIVGSEPQKHAASHRL